MIEKKKLKELARDEVIEKKKERPSDEDDDDVFYYYLHKVPGNALDGFEASQHVEIKQV